jgi:hypothetical protein
MENLYERYGKLILQSEILQNQIQECKRQIIEQAKKPKDEKDTPQG